MAKSVIRSPKRKGASPLSKGGTQSVGASPSSRQLPTKKTASPTAEGSSGPQDETQGDTTVATTSSVSSSSSSPKVPHSKKVTSSTTGKAVRSRSLQREYLNRLTQEFDPDATLEEILGLPADVESNSSVLPVLNGTQPSPRLSELAPDALVAQERLWTIYDAILSGYPRSFIEYQYAVQFDVTIRAVRAYYTTAKRLIAAIAKETQVEMLTHHMAFRRQLRVKALEREDLELAFAAAKDEAKLYGLYPEQSLAVNVSATASLHLPAEVLHLLDVVYGPKDGQTAITREGMGSLDDYEGTEGYEGTEFTPGLGSLEEYSDGDEYSDEELGEVLASSSGMDRSSSEMRDQEEVL